MSCFAYRLAAFGAFCACAGAASWGAEVGRSPNFEVYSQGSAGAARSVLLQFERLHAFFQQQTGLVLDNRSPVRVIAFSSPQEYWPYRIHPTADAYYVGSMNRDYIVMVTPTPGDFRIPAHEYAHFVLHANAIKLPPWLFGTTFSRTFAYWTALANSLTELGRREEAISAPAKAATFATTPDERAHAAQLERIARTDVTVQFTRNPDGTSRLITTRIPHGTTGWNPFIEPSDNIRRADGALQAINCDDGHLHLQVATGEKLLTIVITDPQRVQMRNAPTEFTCGTQPPNRVTVIYAASQSFDETGDGVARGIEFH